MTDRGWEAASLRQLEGASGWMHIRKHFDIAAFGVNARVAHEPGELINEHTETGGMTMRHEELYLVLSGRARFTVDGEELNAPAGTLVFVRDPSLRRAATAEEPETVVLAIGARRGAAFEVSPWERLRNDFWPHYEGGDYEAAVAALQRALERFPDNPRILYNLACCESLLGRRDDAVEHLTDLLSRAEGADEMRELMRNDSDFDVLRDDPRVAALLQ